MGGWFGMAWVKWITHIRVIAQPILGYWQARDYFRWERTLGEPMLVPLAEMEVKAQIARPVPRALIGAKTSSLSKKPSLRSTESSSLESS